MESEELLRDRYLRHIMLEDVGWEGQQKLAKASVLVVGAGGLGSPVCLYLSAAGIGKIGVVDYDKVELSNLQRQVIHNTQNLGELKTNSAKQKMQSINPNVIVDSIPQRFSAKNALSMIEGYDFVIDATDDFPTKFLINHACVLASKPFSHAGVLKYGGQTMTFTKGSACLACAFESPPPKDMLPMFRAGLFGVIPGLIGCVQAGEAIKYILGIGNLLTNTLLSIDLKNLNFRKVDLRKNDNCDICSENAIKSGLRDYD